MSIANLNHNVYEGWPIISFVKMGGHRFELCLAQELLPEAQTGFPKTGFSVTEENLAKLRKELDEAEIEYEGPIAYPDASLRATSPLGGRLAAADVAVASAARLGAGVDAGSRPFHDDGSRQVFGESTVHH